MKQRSIEQQLELNKALNQLATPLADIAYKIKEPVEVVLLLAFADALKTHQSIVLLAENKLGQDAYKLARTLYEINLNIKYIQKENTTTRVEQYFSYVPVEKLKLYNCLTDGNPENKKIFADRESEQCDGNTTIKDIRLRASAAKKKFPVFSDRRGWTGMNIDDLAKKEIKEKTSYDTRYRLSSGFVHFNPIICDSYIKLENQIVLIRVENDEKNLLDALLIGYAEFQWILYICNSQGLFDVKSTLKELNERYLTLDANTVKKFEKE